MEKILIQGENRLNGETTISGMKNSALPIIFSCLLIKDECILENIPRVSDVYNSLSILRSMGAKAEFVDRNTVKINTCDCCRMINEFSLVSKMRASCYLMGTCFSRFGGVCLPMPGGCNFGARPIDLHIKGLNLLGAIIEEKDGIINISSKNKNEGCKIELDKISVGATINIILASVLIKGKTVICNGAREPHVDDLISFLNKAGANIVRNDKVITVCGVDELRGVRYTIYPDMIESLTYMTCAGAAKGRIRLKRIEPAHLTYVCEILKKMSMEIDLKDNYVDIVSEHDIIGANVVTEPYPFFPTDLHPQFASLLCYSTGGTIREELFPGRFAYVTELRKMGAKIKKTGNIVEIEKSEMVSAELDATDLRAGAGLIVASLGAKGESIINNVNYIVRGYEDFVGKITELGGNIKILQGEIK